MFDSDEILNEPRKQIDQIDYQIHDLLNKRAKIALQIADIKIKSAKEEKVTFYRPSREETVLKKIKEHNQGPFSDSAIAEIFKTIMQVSCQLQITTVGHQKKNSMTIGIQGDQGSFSEAAALSFIEKNHIKKTEINYLINSAQVLSAIENHNIDLGIIAISNKKGGLVKESIQALAKNRCQVVDSIEFLVHHQLMALPGVLLSEITEIHSHPQAFAQCQDKLIKHFNGVKLIEAADTALAAKQLGSKQLPQTAAVIGNENCARLYDLQILTKNINDMEKNITLFLVVKNNASHI